MARKNLLDKTLHHTPCIEAYKETYANALATKFDPISRQMTSRAMCAEFVKMINELLQKSQASLPNVLRYSYLVSLHVDLETQQTDTYAACIEMEASTNPRKTCIEIMTTPGYFDLYSNDAKAEVCTTATHSLDEIRTR